MNENNYGYAQILYEDESKIGLSSVLSSSNTSILPYSEIYLPKKIVSNIYDLVKMSEDWFHITLYENSKYPEIHIEAFKSG